MPLKRRLPKFGFTSRQARFSEQIRSSALNKLEAEIIDREVLVEARLVGKRAKKLKVIAAGSINRPVILRGVRATKGAQALIEAVGGKIED